jgi:DNA-binding LacI/PurR family transcriptional regulator
MAMKTTPTVRSIVEAVREQIRDGSLAPGRRLPSEMELAGQFRVSRGSVRKAIEMLVDAGDVARRPHSRPTIAGSRTPVRLASKTDVYVWVAQTIADDSSLPFLQGISKGLAGTQYRMAVREPSMQVGNVIRADERQFLSDLMHKPSAAGAIIWRDVWANDEDVIEELIDSGLPVVFVDSAAPAGLQADHVGTGNIASARRCVEHLLELGHRRVVCVTESDIPQTLTDRVTGYYRAMRQAGLEEYAQCIVRDRVELPEGIEKPIGSGIYGRSLAKGSAYHEIAHRVVLKILALDPLPTALFIGYDVLAYWVCAVLEGYGVKIPEQMSVVGFDWRAHWDKNLADALTTASQDFEGFGRYSADLVLDRIEGSAPSAARHVLLDAPLIIRSSTATPQFSRSDANLVGFSSG